MTAAESDLTRIERRYVRDRYNGSMVKVDIITRNVTVRTWAPRGDGGPVPWWRFVGYVSDVRRDIADGQ